MKQFTVSNCCGATVDSIGALHLRLICKECGKPCKPIDEKEFFSPGHISTMTLTKLAEHLGTKLWIVMEIARWTSIRPKVEPEPTPEKEREVTNCPHPPDVLSEWKGDNMKYLVIAFLLVSSVCWAATYNWENAPKEERPIEVKEKSTYLIVSPNSSYLTFDYKHSDSSIVTATDYTIRLGKKEISVSKMVGEIEMASKVIKDYTITKRLLIIWQIFNSILIFILWRRTKR